MDMTENPVVLSKSAERALKTICANAQRVNLEDGGTLYGWQIPRATDRRKELYVDSLDISASQRGYGSNHTIFGYFLAKASRTNSGCGVIGGYHTHPRDYGNVPKTSADMERLRSHRDHGDKVEVIVELTTRPQMRAWKLGENVKPKEIEVAVDQRKEGNGVIGVINTYLNLDNKRICPHPLKRIFNV